MALSQELRQPRAEPCPIRPFSEIGSAFFCWLTFPPADWDGMWVPCAVVSDGAEPAIAMVALSRELDGRNGLLDARGSVGSSC